MLKDIFGVVGVSLFVACVSNGGAGNGGFGETDHGAFVDSSQSLLDAPKVEVIEKPQGGTDERALYQSGSRIKAKIYSTSDGAKSFAYWYDTQLDVACSFYPDPQGVTRCLPSIIYSLDVSGSKGDLKWTGWFQDAACKKRLLPFATRSSPTACPHGVIPRWAKTCKVSECGVSASCQLFEVGEVFSGSTYFVMNDKNQCVEFPDPMEWPNDAAALVGSEVSFSLFQEATIDLE